MQRSTVPPVVPDVAVDRLVTDRELTLERESSRDLLGTPQLPQTIDHDRPLGVGKALVAARARTPAAGHLRCREWPVAPVSAAVAPQLATDGARVPTQDARDRRLAVAVSPERGKCISLLRGELVVFHECLRFLGRKRSSGIHQLASTSGAGPALRTVALSI